VTGMFPEVPRFSGGGDVWDSETAGPILLADYFTAAPVETVTASGTLTLTGTADVSSTAPAFVSGSVLVAPIGNINANTTPQTLDAPAGLDVGHLLVVAIWPAQGLGTTNTITTPAGLTKISTDPVNPERLAGVYATIVTDPADFTGGITIATSSFSSRLAAVAQAWAPGADHEWDWATVIAAGPEWNGTTMSADTFPALSARDLTLGAAFTNKGASTTLTTHTADGGGTDTTQCLAVSAASGSVSDSVVSLTRDGTGVSFNIAQANGLTYTIGLDQVPVGGGAPERTGTGTLTLTGTADAAESLPTVTGHGFVSVTQMLETPGATWAHRNLGGTYPEMTEYGVRSAANLGYGVIEISCQRTSDGVWFGAHDQTPDRVAVQTTHDGTNFSALTWAQVSAMAINVGSTGGARPFATLEDLVTTLPSDFIFLVDPKQSGDNATYRDEFLDLLDTLLGPTRAIVKLDAYANINTFIDAKARDYLVATYFYAAPSSPTGSTIVEARLPYTDLPGLNYNATQPGWDDYLDPAGAYYSLAVGKPMWGHVCASQANADEATGKGATYIQSTSDTITPVGVEAWTPQVTGTGTLTLSGAGVSVEREVTTGTGTVTLSGTAATVPVEARAAAGVLTLTGVGAGVEREIATATGALTVSGTAAAVGREITTATGTLTLTGSGVSVEREIVTATGTLTLTGTAAAEEASATETRTATGTLTATGTAEVQFATVAVGILTLGVALTHAIAATGTGVLTLTGGAYVPGPRTAPTLTAPNRTLTGATVARTLTGTTGTRTLTGNTSTLTLTGGVHNRTLEGNTP